MINKRITCLFICFVFSLPASASCDSCAKAALDAASAAIKAAVKSTTNVVTANGRAIEAMNASVQSGTSALSSSLQILNQMELTALDAVVKTLSLTLRGMSVEQTQSTDHLITSIKQIEEELKVADLAIENSKLIGPMSQTLSGDINTARAYDLATGFSKRKALKTLYHENMKKWLDSSGYVNNLDSEVLASKEEYWDILPLLQKDILTNEEANNLQVLIQLIANPNPKKRTSQDALAVGSNGVDNEISRLRENAVSSVVHDILATALVDKAPIIPTNEAWMKSYFKLEKGEEETISFNQFYEAETVGKLLSPDWFLDIKSRTEAGLLREQIYQTNTTNALLAEILKAERNETKILSLSVLQRNAR